MQKLVAAALLMGSCSWALMETVPEHYDAHREPRCTGTKGFAAMDALALAGDIGVLAAASGLPNDSSGGGVLIAGAVLDGVLHLASAFTGVGWAEKCLDARDAHDALPPATLAAERPATARDAGADAIDALPTDATPDARVFTRPVDTEEPPRR